MFGEANTATIFMFYFTHIGQICDVLFYFFLKQTVLKHWTLDSKISVSRLKIKS